jgi:hypothetical protein
VTRARGAILAALVVGACAAPARSSRPVDHVGAPTPRDGVQDATAIVSLGDPKHAWLPPPRREIPAGFVQHRARHDAPSVAYQWVEILREVTGREVDVLGARPTIISRQMAIPMTAMFDAWAAYDDKAVGTRLGGKLRRPAAERTQRNKEKAISHAIHRVLVDLFPAEKDYLAAEMKRLGFDPADGSTSPASPQGVGNLAADALLAYRHADGANQLGDEPGTRRREPYADFTFYEPKNPNDHTVDPDRWQPIPFSDGHGGTFHPGFLTPHWFRVKPFALERGDALRPGPPPKIGSEALKRDVDEVIAMNATLSLEDKAIVELMRDGPRSTGQSGHWLQLAEDVSRRDHLGLDADVRLFFTIANTAFDAFIAAWDGKRVHDSARPYALVRHYYAGRIVVGYLGPGRGFGPTPVALWRPYSPETFVTPPFPGFPSGHSTVSGACAKMLELVTGSDRFGSYERHVAGKWTEPGVPPRAMQAIDGRPAEGLPETAEVVLLLPTFSATAEMAGISRVLGGYHIQSDNVEGLRLGRAVAETTWPRYRAYFDGSAAR